MFEKLGDPELIIKFQQLCGLKWEDDKSKSIHAETLQNGSASADQVKPYCNGMIIHSQREEGKYEYNPCVHLLFHLSSALGDEQVLIAVLSFIFWNIDPWAIMQLYLSLAFSLYLGQSAKDVVMSPRPPSPPVVRVEKKYAEEYSMPSTHAMVGMVVPFSLIYFTHEKYEYPIIPALIAASICCFLVGASRVYLGMHTVKDVLAGLIFECAIIIIILPYMKEFAMENWCQTSPNALVTAIILPGILLLVYPTSTPTTFNTYSDMAMVLGIVGGSIISLRFSAANEKLMLEFNARAQRMSGLQLMWSYSMRFVVGSIILGLTRVIMKWCITSSLSKILPRSMIMKPLGYKRFVEIPHKIVTYGMVGFSCIYIVPKVFQFCGV